jgi:hypothetical protein
MSVWVVSLLEHTWEDDIYDVQLYKSLEGVESFLQDHWKKWRYRADLDEGFGPSCPTVDDIRKIVSPNKLISEDEKILVDFGGDYNYSILIKIQFKYINE